jgi:hypothetical protein
MLAADVSHGTSLEMSRDIDGDSENMFVVDSLDPRHLLLWLFGRLHPKIVRDQNRSDRHRSAIFSRVLVPITEDIWPFTLEQQHQQGVGKLTKLADFPPALIYRLQYAVHGSPTRFLLQAVERVLASLGI